MDSDVSEASGAPSHDVLPRAAPALRVPPAPRRHWLAPVLGVSSGVVLGTVYGLVQTYLDLSKEAADGRDGFFAALIESPVIFCFDVGKGLVLGLVLGLGVGVVVAVVRALLLRSPRAV